MKKSGNMSAPVVTKLGGLNIPRLMLIVVYKPIFEDPICSVEKGTHVFTLKSFYTKHPSNESHLEMRNRSLCSLDKFQDPAHQNTDASTTALNTRSLVFSGTLTHPRSPQLA